MVTNVIMPALGMSQDDGTLVRWKKKEGEKVLKGEPLIEIETDKATIDIEAPATGILANVIASNGDVVPVGQVIAVIQAPNDPLPGSNSFEEQTKSAKDVNATPLAARVAAAHNIDLNLVKPEGGRIEKDDVLSFIQKGEQKQSPSRSRLVAASPKARRLAQEWNIDLNTIKGSGPEGAVIEQDLLAHKQAASFEEQAEVPLLISGYRVEEQLISRIWRIMAERTTQSWTTQPHFYLQREINATGFIEWRKRARAISLQEITYTDLLVKVTSIALVRNPRINAFWQDNKIYRIKEISIGIAIAIEDGLVVPVIHRANELGLEEIAVRRKELEECSRQGKLEPKDIAGGSFTISNLGMYGIDIFNAVLNPPQSALLAVGRITERVVAINSIPVVQPTMILSLSCDHRVIDGVHGAKFLDTVARFIEDPLGLLM